MPLLQQLDEKDGPLQELCFRHIELHKELFSWKKRLQSIAREKELAERFWLDLQDVVTVTRDLGYNFSMVNDNPESWPATIGRFEIKRSLGQGNMGVVYLAHDPDLNRRIAIKVLKKNITAEDSDIEPNSARARFEREAQIMAQVSDHPNIVTVYDIGKHLGQIYIAMEYVDGITLKEWIHSQSRSWEDMRDMFLQAAVGLQVAHAKALVHRDFKPDNCLVGTDGILRVVDFGLARPVSGYKSGNSMFMSESDISKRRDVELTQTGTIQGTPAYMAPEQFLAQPATAKTDQFSFCVALYEALSGWRPFHALELETLSAKVIKGEVMDPPKKGPVPSWVWDAILKGIKPHPEYRWDSMQDLTGALLDPPAHIVASQLKKRRHTILLATVVTIAMGWWFGIPQIDLHLQRYLQVDPPRFQSSFPHGLKLSHSSTLSKEDVHQGIDREYHLVDQCFKRWRHYRAPEDLKDQPLRVVVEFHISHKGIPSNFHVVTTSPYTNVPNADKNIGACIIGTAGQAWHFPHRLATTKVSYPFLHYVDTHLDTHPSPQKS